MPGGEAISQAGTMDSENRRIQLCVVAVRTEVWESILFDRQKVNGRSRGDNL